MANSSMNSFDVTESLTVPMVATNSCTNVCSVRCGDCNMINHKLLCDGTYDCRDRSDETSDECTFKCKNGKSITKHLICNGNDDCGDGSDERQRECTCNNGKQISRSLMCNGVNDCLDNSDVYSCGFIFNNGKRIRKHLICNGYDDCGDGSDESQRECMFTCNNGMQINNNLKCNGVDDCRDNSDEYSCGHTNAKFIDTGTTKVACTQSTPDCSAYKAPDEWICNYNKYRHKWRGGCHCDGGYGACIQERYNLGELEYTYCMAKSEAKC